MPNADEDFDWLGWGLAGADGIDETQAGMDDVLDFVATIDHLPTKQKNAELFDWYFSGREIQEVGSGTWQSPRGKDKVTAILDTGDLHIWFRGPRALKSAAAGPPHPAPLTR